MTGCAVHGITSRCTGGRAAAGEGQRNGKVIVNVHETT
jgi:hypothetical protein